MASIRHSLEIASLSKHYGGFAALDDVSLRVEAGEFLTLLGPSGSGKTTLLMSVAGFTQPSDGDIRLDGASILALPPERRNFGMVFQGYALFPHLSVARNVAFPLEVRGRPNAEIATRVSQALGLVQLDHLADRLPKQLSGGQQQRVALARSLVFEPHLLLLDEPLSALDRKLRLDVQLELKSLHRQVGRTFIYVTHDQDEALSMSDRIAIMRDGRIVQQGSPQELYDRPRTRFVAGFLGRSNFIAGEITGRNAGEISYRAGGIDLRQAADAVASPVGAGITIALRPEKLRVLALGEAAANTVSGQVANWSYFGTAIHVVAKTAVGELSATLPTWRGGPPPEIGAPIGLGWDPDASTMVVEDGDAQAVLAEAA